MSVGIVVCECGATESRRGSRHRYCRPCAVTKVRETSRRSVARWRERHPEQRKEASRRYYDSARGQRAVRERLLGKFGLTPEEYDELLAAQNGLCAICGRPERAAKKSTGKPYFLSVDHDHETGRVRGLLCRTCNSAIGMLEDDQELFRAAIAYLARAA